MSSSHDASLDATAGGAIAASVSHASSALLAAQEPRRWRKRLLLTLGILAFAAFLAWSVALRQSRLFLVGIGMGAVLAGCRFGFTTAWRIFIEKRDPSGIIAQLLLIGVAAAVCIPLLAANPIDLRAALGPPSISLLVGAFLFGGCMQVADGCGSGTLYKAGMGIPLNTVILPLFAIGSFLGSATLERWLSLGAIAPVSLVGELGGLDALLATLAGLVAIGVVVLYMAAPSARKVRRAWLFGAVALALLAILNLVIAGQPWGVVYGFGLWAAKVATAVGLFDPATNGFWREAVNTTTLQQSVFLDITSITDIGILAGALWIAAGKARPSKKSMTAKQWVVSIVAGLLLGYSSRLAFGCNIGAMVSGISTGSLHGWIWVVMAFMGSIVGLKIRRHFAL